MEGYMDFELRKNRIIYLGLVRVHPLVVRVIVIHHPLSLPKRNLERYYKRCNRICKNRWKREIERVTRKNREKRARANGKEKARVSRKDGEKRRRI